MYVFDQIISKYNKGVFVWEMFWENVLRAVLFL